MTIFLPWDKIFARVVNFFSKIMFFFQKLCMLDDNFFPRLNLFSDTEKTPRRQNFISETIFWGPNTEKTQFKTSQENMRFHFFLLKRWKIPLQGMFIGRMKYFRPSRPRLLHLYRHRMWRVPFMTSWSNFKFPYLCLKLCEINLLGVFVVEWNIFVHIDRKYPNLLCQKQHNSHFWHDKDK